MMEISIRPLEEDGGTVLDALEGERIVSFDLFRGKLVVSECCDRYFQCLLTKDQLSRLICELSVIYSSMPE